MTSKIDQCITASLLITRAEGGRSKAYKAIKMMSKNPKSFRWLVDYVTASTQVEEAELQLLRIKKELGK